MISLSKKWKKWNERQGDLRFRQRANCQRWILCARSSITQDAENGNPDKLENAPDSLNIPEASFLCDATLSEATFDGCIAEFLPLSEQQDGEEWCFTVRKFCDPLPVFTLPVNYEGFAEDVKTGDELVLW